MSDHNPDGNDSLKLKTARTLKWNTIDRVASQLLYAVVGIVLANMLSQEDFGLVGALLIFQAFATILTEMCIRDRFISANISYYRILLLVINIL